MNTLKYLSEEITSYWKKLHRDIIEWKYERDLRMVNEMRRTKIHYIMAQKGKSGEKEMILKITREKGQITYIGMTADRIIIEQY